MKFRFLNLSLALASALFFFTLSPSKGDLAFTISSPAFKNGEAIPALYTADGKDISPPLSWENTPKRTKSFVLICDDPDAPGDEWVHWILYNIPPTLTSLDEGGKNLPTSVVKGTNSFERLTYGGPNPPAGTHRYYFKLYALDHILELQEGATKNDLLKAMEGHTLGQTHLIGTYKRN